MTLLACHLIISSELNWSSKVSWRSLRNRRKRVVMIWGLEGVLISTESPTDQRQWQGWVHRRRWVVSLFTWRLSTCLPIICLPIAEMPSDALSRWHETVDGGRCQDTDRTRQLAARASWGAYARLSIHLAYSYTASQPAGCYLAILVEIERGQLQPLERVELVAKSSRATRAASGPWSPSRLVVETKERRRRGNGEHNEHKRLCWTFHIDGVLLVKTYFRKLIFERICISVWKKYL